MEDIIGMTICNPTLNINRGLYCKRCNISLKSEMIIFYTGNSREEYICNSCRNLRNLKQCSHCHQSLKIELPIHIVNDLPICHDCYKDSQIKEPDIL